MGLSKSKAPKPGQQPGLQQPGFPGQPQYSNQQPGLSLNPPSFQTQPFSGPPAPQSSAFPSQAGFPLQTGFPPSQLGYPSSFPSQPGFSGFQSSVFPQSTSYPVSYPSQPFRPLIPGYAPAPPSERRSNVVQEQEQTDYVSRYYDQQIGQVPQLAQMHSGKPRKH